VISELEEHRDRSPVRESVVARIPIPAGAARGGGHEYLETVARVLLTLLLLFVFLAGVNGLSAGFKMLGKDVLGAFFAATANPFMGLVVGILATTLVQSSSVTTSMIVAMVAAPENALPLANAVPMVMGANIGTTVTNTLASLAHVGRRHEFRRAFAVATCHDFFNFLAVAVLLPLEIATGLLRRCASLAKDLVIGLGGIDYESPLKSILKNAVVPAQALAEWMFATTMAQAVLLIGLSVATIFVALLLLVRSLKSVMRTRAEIYVTRALNTSTPVAILLGMLITVSVQSSSITTSLLVPLAGAGLLTLERAFPITLGANVGTTITALLASMAVSGPNAAAGVTIALVHLFFNLIGVALVYGVPGARALPLLAASRLADTAVESRRLAFLYVLGLFYGLPALLIFVFRLL
jgi:sodium-dependent phosphate cotransporter